MDLPAGSVHKVLERLIVESQMLHSDTAALLRLLFASVVPTSDDPGTRP
jgi:hypothetical protein